MVQLVENGFEPVLVDDFSNSNASVLDGLAAICGRPLRCHALDCRDRSALRRVFAQEGPMAGVIHFAASKAVGESQAKPLHYYSNNLGSLLAVVEVMLEFQVPELVFSSSCTVYGQPASLPVTEATPIAPPASVYGATKQMCEQILFDLVASRAPVRVMLLRYFNPIGAHPSARIGELPLGEPQNLAPIILQSAAGLRGPVQIFGDDWSTPDGTCIRDYIHVLDLAEAHVRALAWMKQEARNSLIEVLNVGTGRGTSVREAIGAMTVTLGGLDALVFTGGIGENSSTMRGSISEGLGCLSVSIDPEKNRAAAGGDVISMNVSGVRVLVIHADEERFIAREAARLSA